MPSTHVEPLHQTEAAELLEARFASLTWHGCPPSSAFLIACRLEVDLLDAITLLQRGCPAELVAPILG